MEVGQHYNGSMAPRKKRPALPEIPDASSGYDELNLGRLALISAQKTVPKTLRKWQKNILTPDGRPVIITCAALDDQMVPHGLDNDFMVGLLNLCFEAGLPDGPFTVSAYGLLRASGFPDTQQYYDVIETSLTRLNKAQYTIDEGWYTQGSQRWTTQSFAQISYLAYSRPKQKLQGNHVITVQLAPPIMESLRAGYIKPLDLNFYRKLTQPLVRAVYRQLDAMHFDESATDGLVGELVLPLMAWGNRLGVVSERPDTIERSLAPAHKELREQGYISDVEITGRGKDKTVRYVFAPLGAPEHPELAAMLTERGVKKGTAVRLSTIFPDRVKEASRRFDHYMQITKKPVQNPGGLMVTMIQRPEDFADVLSTAPPVAVLEQKKRKVAATVDLEIKAKEETNSKQVEALSGQALIDWVFTRLTLYGILKHLSTTEKTLLSEALESGSLDGRQLVRQVNASLTTEGLNALSLAGELRKHLKI